MKNPYPAARRAAVRGAAAATTFSQFVSGIGIGLYTLKKFPQLCPKKRTAGGTNRTLPPS